MTHRLTLNMPSHTRKLGLDPNQAVLLLDGKPIQGLMGFTLVAGICAEGGDIHGRTTATIVFEVEVDGVFEVEEKILPAPDV